MPTAKAKTKDSSKPKIPPLTIRNARLVYRNFSGEALRFNAKGLRNFHVILNHDQATELEKVGWNIKWPKPREDGETREPTLKVKVRFDNYPPEIVMLTKKGKTFLDEKTVSLLDRADIESVDLRVTGSYNELDAGWKGFTCYLSQMAVRISDQDFMTEYLDTNDTIPNSG